MPDRLIDQPDFEPARHQQGNLYPVQLCSDAQAQSNRRFPLHGGKQALRSDGLYWRLLLLYSGTTRIRPDDLHIRRHGKVLPAFVDFFCGLQLLPTTLAYATVRRGFNSGGINLSPPVPYNTEKIDDEEIGLKNDFHIYGAPLRVNISAFHSKFRDIQRQITTFVDGPA